jgi:hypothetical protein
MSICAFLIWAIVTSSWNVQWLYSFKLESKIISSSETKFSNSIEDVIAIRNDTCVGIIVDIRHTHHNFSTTINNQALTHHAHQYNRHHQYNHQIMQWTTHTESTLVFAVGSGADSDFSISAPTLDVSFVSNTSIVNAGPATCEKVTLSQRNISVCSVNFYLTESGMYNISIMDIFKCSSQPKIKRMYERPFGDFQQGARRQISTPSMYIYKLNATRCEKPVTNHIAHSTHHRIGECNDLYSDGAGPILPACSFDHETQIASGITLNECSDLVIT